MDKLQKVALKIAKKDPEVRWALIREMSKSAGRSMKVEEDSSSSGGKAPPSYVAQYIREKLRGKKFTNRETGREVGAGRMMQVDEAFKKKVYEDAKKWWEKTQKKEKKDPKAMARRVTITQVQNATGKANKLIRDLESKKKKPSDVAADAADHIQGLEQLYQRARKVDPEMGNDVRKTIKKLKSLSEVKRSHQGPKLRGRKTKQANMKKAADLAYEMLFGK